MLLIHQSWPVHDSFSKKSFIFLSILIPLLTILDLSSTPSLRCVEYQVSVKMSLTLFPWNDVQLSLEHHISMFDELFIEYSGIWSESQETMFCVFFEIQFLKWELFILVFVHILYINICTHFNLVNSNYLWHMLHLKKVNI